MNQAALAWRAFRNMLRAAARDPLGAIIAIITAPFRLWQPVAGLLILILLMLLGLGFAGEVILSWLGFPLGSLPHSLFYFLLSLLVLWMVVRSITAPLIANFGDMDGDTHGSARFATDKEVAPLTRTGGGSGLVALPPGLEPGQHIGIEAGGIWCLIGR
ncbi:hypothetical protein SAMN05878426_11524 [Phaeovulum vinaykumarii]|uniref:Type IV secretion system protein VirD4 n=1 Tax=Phaeovulum vinaykumarii TaxID=407234 RepID=A0A1N7N209_9RHOB|nr:hypothetical protein [Phaeovulum vinaykumarii]SIS92380.1 type IV secretion system protein VirD4 [Phaeovulum vinaykumarii]SOC18671.1 hypothetical protein SAMN05878426_11524 [Phaeovulum vinaykumarii]